MIYSIERRRKKKNVFYFIKPQLNIIEPGFWGRTPSRLNNQRREPPLFRKLFADTQLPGKRRQPNGSPGGWILDSEDP